MTSSAPATATMRSSCSTPPSSSGKRPVTATRWLPIASPRWSPARARSGRGPGARAHALVPARQPRRGQRARAAIARARACATRRRRAAARCAMRSPARRTRRQRRRARAMLAGAEVRLVMTAHPTEARRRTTIDKLARIFAVLRDSTSAARCRRRARRAPPAAATVQELWGSDEIRAVSPTVLDEVHAGLDLLHVDARRRGSRRSTAISRTALAAAYPASRRGSAAAELRHLDRRRPRRQPVRHARRDGASARADARAVPALPRDGASSCSPDGCRCQHRVGGRRRRSSRSLDRRRERLPELAG